MENRKISLVLQWFCWEEVKMECPIKDLLFFFWKMLHLTTKDRIYSFDIKVHLFVKQRLSPSCKGKICQSDQIFPLVFPNSCVQIIHDAHVSWALDSFTDMSNTGLHIFRRIWRSWRRSRVDRGKWLMDWKLEFMKKGCEIWFLARRKVWVVT